MLIRNLSDHKIDSLTHEQLKNLMKDLRNDAQSLVEYVTPRGPVWGSSIVTQEIAETYKKQRLRALKPGFTI